MEPSPILEFDWAFSYLHLYPMKLLSLIAAILCVVSIANGQEVFTVHKVETIGNKFLSDGDLRSILLTKASPPGIFQFTYRLLHIGGPPVTFDPLVLRADSIRLVQFYRDQGFFYATINDSVAHNIGHRSVDVFFLIHEGQPAYVDSLNLHGAPGTSEKLWKPAGEKPALSEGDRYSAAKLDQEIVQVIGLLQNNGYAYARRGSAPVVHISPPDRDSVQVAVDLYFHSGKRYDWGPITVRRADSSLIHVNNQIILREMLFRTGDEYSDQKKTESEQRLYALNMFDFAKIRIPDAPPSGDSLAGIISLRSRAVHEITPELLVNNENNTFNFGGGLGYIQRNFLGDARLLSINTSLLLESLRFFTFSQQVLRDTTTAGRIDATAQLTQPYLFSNRTSLTWGVSFLVDKELPYLQLVATNKIRVSDQFAQYTTGYIEWDVERAKVDSLQAIEIPPGLETPQFNSILSFTIQRDKTNNPFYPTKGFFNLLTVDEGGVLPSLINSTFKHAGFPFAQFWELTLLGRWYFSLDKGGSNVFAMKTKVGYAQEYGTFQQDSTGPIPLNYRYYAGGSGSIRGWRTRQLGDVIAPEYGGNMLVESNFEDRYYILGPLGGVVFIDAGNLWNSYKQISLSTIAVATGVGLRYDTMFGPLRIDFGFRLYDPNPSPGANHFMFQNTARTIFRQMVVHFGIGQAF